MVSVAALVGLVVVALPAEPWAGSTCPAALGDGITDDTSALQCLLEEGDADEAIQLRMGATYLITGTLFPTKKKIYGGAGPQASVTTVSCKSWNFSAFSPSRDLAVYGVRVDHCKSGFSATGNLTLVDSTIHATNDHAVFVNFERAGDLTLVNCTINTTSKSAVKVNFERAGNLTLMNSTITGPKCSAVYVNFYSTGNLTLADSTVSGGGSQAVSVRTRGSREGPPPTVSVSNSKFLGLGGHGIMMIGIFRLVMAGSEIAKTKGYGVLLKNASSEAVLELHSSKVRDCASSAIMVQSSEAASVLLAGGSSAKGCIGPCIGVVSGISHRVNITGDSWIEDCLYGVLLEGTSESSVVLEGGSSIRGSRHALVLQRGSGNRVAIQNRSRVQKSSLNGVKVTGGAGQKIEVSGDSAIEDSGGSGISVEAGSAHEVSITDGSSLRKSGHHGVLLAALKSRLRLEGVTIRESGGSAVSARLSASVGAAWAGPGDECTFNLSLQSVYLVRNGGGFYCEHACAGGQINGTIYFNSVDFHNSCSGELSQQGPLSGVAEFRILTAHLQWCSLGMAASAGLLPWWRVCSRARTSPRSCLAPLVLGAMVVLLVLTTHAWVANMLDLWRVMQVSKREDLAEEGVSLLFALACFLAFVVPPMSFAVSQWWHRFWQKAEVLELLRPLEASLWQGHSEEVQLLCARLAERGLASAEIQGRVRELRRQQSLEAGVSVAYLLSPEFLELARARTGLQDPTFLQMKDPFWSGEDAIGKGELCPRDGCPGCALVDTLHPRHRQRCTHFLSWVWQYPLLLVREALEIWVEEEELDPSQTFLFMCFFVNNQFRILIEGTQAGSDDLETTFERNLQRIGRVVALLDHWRRPLYLSRIWTIYEQYMAAKLQLPVTVILNRGAGESLIEELDKGKDGIIRVTEAFRSVDAETAQASVKEDEEHVKAIICHTTGFDYVNQRVRQSMITWVGSMIKRHMDALVRNAGEQKTVADRHELARRVSCARPEGDASMVALEVERSR